MSNVDIVYVDAGRHEKAVSDALYGCKQERAASSPTAPVIPLAEVTPEETAIVLVAEQSLENVSVVQSPNATVVVPEQPMSSVAVATAQSVPVFQFNYKCGEKELSFSLPL